MNPLFTFYNNEVQREAVRAFFSGALREMAADYALVGESTNGIKDAHTCIEKAFDKLEELYAKVNPAITTNAR